MVEKNLVKLKITVNVIYDSNHNYIFKNKMVQKLTNHHKRKVKSLFNCLPVDLVGKIGKPNITI